MASTNISIFIVFILLLGALVSGSEDSHSHNHGNYDHDGHIDNLNQNTNLHHINLRESFLDAKKRIDEKYLDCDPYLIKLNQKIEDAFKSHDHSEVSNAIEELRNFQPSQASDPCKDNPIDGNGGSYTISHEHGDNQHIKNHVSTLSPGSIWSWKNMAIITSGLLALIL